MFEDNEALDGAATRLADTAERLLNGEVKDALQGKWLGHPLHPMLTDIPIGCFTSALVLDLFGGRRARPAADGLIALGVASALPTAAAGLADWTELGRRGRRVGLVHAAANATGVALYAWSLSARLRGHRLRGVMLGVAGAGAMTAGGYLGGRLVFGLKEEPSEAASDARPPLPTPDSDPRPSVEAAIAATT